MSPRTRFVSALALLVAVFITGTAGYVIIEADKDVTFFQAAYMTAITLSTVGFGEQWSLSPAARWWTLGVITFGIGAVSVAFTSLLTMFVSGELRSLRDQRKMEATIQALREHVIVCGYGRMGSLVARELKRRGVPLAVVELRRDVEINLREAQLPFLLGDATDEQNLLKAGIARAKALVVAMPHDADNVFITLTAHALNPTLTIVARAEQASTEPKLLRAGASRVVCPAFVGATTIANVLTRPNVVDFVELAAQGVELEIDEYHVRSHSSLCGKPLRDSLVREKTGATVVAVKRADGKTLYSPRPDTVLRPDDTLIVVGPVGASSSLDRIETSA